MSGPRVSVTLDPEPYRVLKELSRNCGAPVAYFARAAIDDYVSRVTTMTKPPKSRSKTRKGA